MCIARLSASLSWLVSSDKFHRGFRVELFGISCQYLSESSVRKLPVFSVAKFLTVLPLLHSAFGEAAAKACSPGGCRFLVAVRELDHQCAKPWCVYAFQSLQLLCLPSSSQFVSTSPAARMQRPLYCRAAGPSSSDCFWLLPNFFFSAVALHQLLVTSVLSNCWLRSTSPARLGQHPALQYHRTLPLHSSADLSLCQPHLLAQTHPL